MFQGDSGSALVIRRNNAWTQIGIVNFGAAGACSAGFPMGYARVTSFLTWIRENSGVGSY
jgi:secreted trypsin-like serine protease